MIVSIEGKTQKPCCHLFGRMLLLSFEPPGDHSNKHIRYRRNSNLRRHPIAAGQLQGEGPEAVAQAEQFYKRLHCPRRFYRLSITDGADSHCGLNNIAFTSALVYDWVIEVFAR